MVESYVSLVTNISQSVLDLFSATPNLVAKEFSTVVARILSVIRFAAKAIESF